MIFTKFPPTNVAKDNRETFSIGFTAKEKEIKNTELSICRQCIRDKQCSDWSMEV